MEYEKLTLVVLILGYFAFKVDCQVAVVETINETDTGSTDYDYGCADGEFDCGGGDCILQADVCDGTQDCGDGVDEKNCTGGDVACRDDQFDCGNGICILKEQRCDGLIHCTNNEDELYCDGRIKVLTTAAIEVTTGDVDYDYKPDCYEEEGDFLCSNEICVGLDRRCDGRNDCGNNDDEKNCTVISTAESRSTTTAPSCGDNKFQCDSGNCISNVLACDGKPDCDDKTDERDCVGSTPTIIKKILTHTTSYVNSTTASTTGCLYNEEWHGAGTHIVLGTCGGVLCNNKSEVITWKDSTCAACLSARTNSIVLYCVALACILMNWR